MPQVGNIYTEGKPGYVMKISLKSSESPLSSDKLCKFRDVLCVFLEPPNMDFVPNFSLIRQTSHNHQLSRFNTDPAAGNNIGDITT